MRPLLAAAFLVALVVLVALAGCDATADLDTYDGIVVVSVVQTDTGPALRLVAEEDAHCARVLRVDADPSPGRLAVRVLGIEVPRGGAECTAVIPALAEVRLPFTSQGVFPVEVTHAGSTDEYRYSIGFAGITFEAVRTSTTRLGGE